MRFDWEPVLGIFLILIALGMLGFVIYMAIEQSATDRRIMAECMKDHKEYECVAMLKKSGNSGESFATGMLLGTAIGSTAARR